MTTNFFSIGGVDYPINEPEDVQRALGNVPSCQIIMTDESGAVIGTGNSVASVNKSMPLVKALRDNQEPLHKTNKRALFTKSAPKGEFGKLIKQMDDMKKSLTVNIDDSDTQERLNNMEAIVVDQITDYLESCISRGILPSQV